MTLKTDSSHDANFVTSDSNVGIMATLDFHWTQHIRESHISYSIPFLSDLVMPL